jgi:hypothetical protein
MAAGSLSSSAAGHRHVWLEPPLLQEEEDNSKNGDEDWEDGHEDLIFTTTSLDINWYELARKRKDDFSGLFTFYSLILHG